jgi:PAS domain S-box-containing protein
MSNKPSTAELSPKSVQFVLQLQLETTTQNGGDYFAKLFEHLADAFPLIYASLSEAHNGEELLRWPCHTTPPEKHNQTPHNPIRHTTIDEHTQTQRFTLALRNGTHNIDGTIQIAIEKTADIKSFGMILQLLRGRIEAEYTNIQLSRSVQSMRKTNLQYTDILQRAQDGIAIFDENRRFLHANPAMLSMFGYDSTKELLGKSWRILYGEQEQIRFSSITFPALLKERAWSGEATAVRKNQTSFDQEIFIALLTDNSTVCICRDISQRKQSEQQLQQTNRELDQATRQKDAFLAHMSHELRTPLNSILGMAELLNEGIVGDLTVQQQKATSTIEKSGHHLLSLINDILDLAKIGAGKMELQYSPISVQDLCTYTVSFVAQMAEKKTISLTTDIPASLHRAHFEADAVRIRQILLNLLSNAIKFTPNGGDVSLHVASTLPPDSHQPGIVFQVTDTGPGIHPADRERLFEPFVQLENHTHSHNSGTGLGLALVQQLTSLHGGTITVTNNPSGGASFDLFIPCIITSSTQRPAPPPQKTRRQSNSFPFYQPNTQAPLILLAEDNEDNINCMSRYLKRKGYRLIIAKNGREALEKASVYQPDIFVMDIQMPEIDGLEVIRQLRTQDNYLNTPILAVTAYAMSGDRETCLEAGANEYLSKPIQLKQLAKTVQSLLDEQPPLLIPEHPTFAEVNPHKSK